jgi:hypothetical protein
MIFPSGEASQVIWTFEWTYAKVGGCPLLLNGHSSKLTSPFGVIAQMWLVLLPRSLQMVSKSPNDARSCGTGALHDMALTRTSEI